MSSNLRVYCWITLNFHQCTCFLWGIIVCKIFDVQRTDQYMTRIAWKHGYFERKAKPVQYAGYPFIQTSCSGLQLQIGKPRILHRFLTTMKQYPDQGGTSNIIRLNLTCSKVSRWWNLTEVMAARFRHWFAICFTFRWRTRTRKASCSLLGPTHYIVSVFQYNEVKRWIYLVLVIAYALRMNGK